MPMELYRFYQTPGLSPGAHEVVLSKLKGSLEPEQNIVNFSTELCFYINAVEPLTVDEKRQLKQLFCKSFQSDKTSDAPLPREESSDHLISIEIGPRLNFSTAFSTNAVSVCKSVGLTKVDRIEQFIRYFIHVTSQDGTQSFFKDMERKLVDLLHDRMTECRYLKPIESFSINIEPEEYYDVDIIDKGKQALEKVNKDLGLAFDDWDLEYYSNLFKERVGRNPTNVECFDLAQSNSEHSRHWFFRGRLVVDGKEIENSLMKMVIKTQETSNNNNVIKFSDNSSAIKGFDVPLLKPSDVRKASKFSLNNNSTRHIIFSAETHNFPTGVAPFPGATTGTGGRIRDVQAAGRGAHVVAGTAGYCFGNLHIPGYKLPWEEDSSEYPNNMAPALEVAVQASNGASDYGNKFGEPVITGFARSFGMNMDGDERREWIKPIMFSGGIGMLDAENILKKTPEIGMEVVKVGGPVYRIGVGGGAASSIQVQGDNAADLDFGAVQRGDAEMEQKMNRAIRACLEMGTANPICSIHDQGAGGNGNVLKEICEPAGAIIRAQDFDLGDPTLSILELWGAEYQESNALLVKKEDIQTLKDISLREKVPVSVVGSITGNGRIVLDSKKHSNGENGQLEPENPNKRQKTESYPVDLELDVVLGSMPRKVFNLERMKPNLTALHLKNDLSVREALDRVLRLPSVASKRYLTNKVDRSVTGLIAQQQCVGPLHTPLADIAVTALSHFDVKGSATAIGEQPIKMLIDQTRGARMTVGEALTNLVFAKITDLKDVKCSANWMWAAKLPGEGAALYDACHAMCDIMAELGMAVDGGKDSLSMAARVGKKTVKAPGSLVVSVYAACHDIRKKVTPDLKGGQGGEVQLIYVDVCNSKKHRLGGSALAQVYGQIGDNCPDLEDVKTFSSAFNVTQSLIEEDLVISGHDVSDGGLVTALLEMAFAGNRGLEIDLKYSIDLAPYTNKAVDLLFAEELGLVLEVMSKNIDVVLERYDTNDVPCYVIGKTGEKGEDASISISIDGSIVLQDKMADLRDIWEATSFQLERLQCNPRCVEDEEKGLRNRSDPPYKLSFKPEVAVPKGNADAPRLAVVREEGSNGDREMVSSFHMAGFEVWDVTMSDICNGSISLSTFRGVVFVGGFSYADVLGSAKGWAAVCQMNDKARQEFEHFLSRDDTFSLGICNGCQLMGLLGWVGIDPDAGASELCPTQGVCFTHNTSERFESRFVTVKIDASPSIMLKGMEGSTLGVWVAHGEGRAEFRRPEILRSVLSQDLAPIRYVDDNGSITMQYPLNPNGSPEGIAAICSPNGRHLAMMPHPERCTLLWQWPWMPEDWKQDLKASPWLKMFCNAYEWCLENKS